MTKTSWFFLLPIIPLRWGDAELKGFDTHHTVGVPRTLHAKTVGQLAGIALFVQIQARDRKGGNGHSEDRQAGCFSSRQDARLGAFLQSRQAPGGL